MSNDKIEGNTFGLLGIIALESSRELGTKIDEKIKEKRKMNGLCYDVPETYIVPIKESRFSNGEGKVKITETARGKDIYILCDIGNYSCTYNMYGYENHVGPDEHFQDIKRALSAINGKARRVTVIMPLLYSSRQHRRKGRESLDCAMAIRELESLGVTDLITFDVHDPNVQNAVHRISFENLYPTYDIVQKLIKNEKEAFMDQKKAMIVSPDTGAMDRAVYYANVLGLDVGLFYKRRDLSQVVNGKNPIVQHEYIGQPVEGKNILIVDDMIASGESMIDVATELKKRGAEKIFMAATFSLFTEGLDKFNKLYSDGLVDKLYSTNLTYVPDKLRNSPWFMEVDMSNFIAEVIDHLNHEKSIEPLIESTYALKKLIDDERNSK